MKANAPFDPRVRYAKLRNIISSIVLPWTFLVLSSIVVTFLVTSAHEITHSRVFAFVITTIALLIFWILMNEQRKRCQMQYWELDAKTIDRKAESILDIFTEEIEKDTKKFLDEVSSLQRDLNSIVGEGFPLADYFEKREPRRDYEIFADQKINELNPGFKEKYDIETKLKRLEKEMEYDDFWDMMDEDYPEFIDKYHAVKFDHYDLRCYLDRLYFGYRSRRSLLSLSTTGELAIKPSAVLKSASIWATRVVQSKHVKLHKHLELKSIYGYVFQRDLGDLGDRASEHLCTILDEETGLMGSPRPVYVFSQGGSR